MKPFAELNVGELGFLEVVIVIVGRFEVPSEEKFIVAKTKKINLKNFIKKII